MLGELEQIEEPDEVQLKQQRKQEGLEKGRRIGLEKMINIQKQRKEENKIKAEYNNILKEQEEILRYENLSNKIREIDAYNTNKKIDELNDKLNRFIEIYEQNTIDRVKIMGEMVEDITKKYLPKSLEMHFLKEKIEAEKKSNPYRGLV